VKEVKMSSGAVAYMIEHPELVDKLGKEELRLLLELVRAERMRLSGAGSCMPQSAMNDLVNCVGDKLVREIVNDQRKGVGEPGGFLPSENSPPREKSSGWKTPPELGAPAGIKYIDQALDVQDALDRRDLEKRLR
jgi:hypothetical protein